jgi:hypothetical protein
MVGSAIVPRAVVGSVGTYPTGEGKFGWLLVGLIALAFVALPLWVRFGGTNPGPLPAVPGDPVAVLLDGQRMTFAAGDLEVGSGLLCQSHGVNLGAWVPKPGHTTHEQYAGPDWTSEIQIRTRNNGVVIVRCT